MLEYVSFQFLTMNMSKLIHTSHENEDVEEVRVFACIGLWYRCSCPIFLFQRLEFGVAAIQTIPKPPTQKRTELLGRLMAIAAIAMLKTICNVR